MMSGVELKYGNKGFWFTSTPPPPLPTVIPFYFQFSITVTLVMVLVLQCTYATLHVIMMNQLIYIIMQVDTEVCEQVFSWLSCCGKITKHMDR